MNRLDEFEKKPFYHNMTTIIIGTTVVDWRTMDCWVVNWFTMKLMRQN